MNKDIMQFMEFQHPEETATNQKWNSILLKMIKTMDQYFDLKTENFNSFSEYVIANKSSDYRNAYFWDWLYEEGLIYLQKTDKALPNTEEIEDFLNYREMLLDMDSESGLVENIIISISELFKSTSSFIETYLDKAIYQSISNEDFNDLRVPKTSIPLNPNLAVEENWKFYESSAKIKAELLVFIKGEFYETA